MRKNISSRHRGTGAKKTTKKEVMPPPEGCIKPVRNESGMYDVRESDSREDVFREPGFINLE